MSAMTLLYLVGVLSNIESVCTGITVLLTILSLVTGGISMFTGAWSDDDIAMVKKFKKTFFWSAGVLVTAVVINLFIPTKEVRDVWSKDLQARAQLERGSK